jgi:predicted phage terminase large subunit-like protein
VPSPTGFRPISTPSRYWYLAATEKTEFNDPDWTVGIKLGRDRNGGYWLLDMVRQRANPGDVEKLLLETAAGDGNRVKIGFGQDPGQAGKSQALHLVRALSAFTVRLATESGDKLTRFGPFSSQCRAGNVKILRGSWNDDLFHVLEGFPDLAHDEEVDACSGALEMLNPEMKGWAMFELTRRQAEAIEKAKASPPPPTPEDLAKPATTIGEESARFAAMLQGRKPTANEICAYEARLLELHNAERGITPAAPVSAPTPLPPLPLLGEAPVPEQPKTLLDLYVQQAKALLAGKASQ